MEVVHIVRQFRPSIGGLEDAVQNLCAHLKSRPGIKVRILTLDRVFTHPDKVLPAHEVIDGVEVTRMSYFGSSRYPIALSVLNEIRSATIVHVHAVDFFFDFLSWTRFLHRKPLVASTHGGFFHSTFASKLKKIWFQTITRFSCTGYAYLCTSSENDAATFSQIAPSKIVTIENGVNIDKWKNKASVEPRRSMIFIGRWSANKAVKVLIDLVAALQKRGVSWTLAIAGIEGAETKASLETYAKAQGVSDQVSILLGPTEGEIGDQIGRSSFIASASTYEGFGISAVEGLSAGLVPLLSRIAPFDKLRKALGLGAAIEDNDLEKSVHNMEAAYAALMQNPEASRTACMNLARQYDWAGVTDRFVDIYQKTLAERKSL